MDEDGERRGAVSLPAIGEARLTAPRPLAQYRDGGDVFWRPKIGSTSATEDTT
jgi:hypothetical protein